MTETVQAYRCGPYSIVVVRGDDGELRAFQEERRVINMHRNLERWLDLPEAELMTGGETA